MKPQETNQLPGDHGSEMNMFGKMNYEPWDYFSNGKYWATQGKSQANTILVEKCLERSIRSQGIAFRQEKPRNTSQQPGDHDFDMKMFGMIDQEPWG